MNLSPSTDVECTMAADMFAQMRGVMTLQRAPNVTPLNHAAGAVVTLMERSNVSTVLCAGKIKKWRGAIVGYDIPMLRAELDVSRDYVFAAAGIDAICFGREAPRRRRCVRGWRQARAVGA